jgi:CBS domain-containing protein
MTKNPVTVKPNSSVQDVAKIMSEKKIGSIIISGNGELSGILTERDLVRKVLAKGKDPKSVKVNDIMSKPVVRINEDSDLLDASELMKKKNIRRLVVVDKTKKIVGILSTNDMARVMRRAIEELTTTYYLMSRER